MLTTILTAAFLYAIALLYGISDITAVQNSPGSFPLAAAYAQATGSKGATFGLLFIIFLSLTPCLIGTFLTVRQFPSQKKSQFHLLEY
jgi:choline transport protein